MACIPVPIPSIPSLPAGLSVTPPTIVVPNVPGLCCKLPRIPLPPIPIDLSVVLTAEPALVIALRAALAAATAYIQQLPFPCPVE